MIVGSIARRYAKALFGLAVEAGRVQAWAEALQALRRAIDGSDELREVLENPVYSREQRRGIAARLAAALQLDPEPASFVSLLADRNRLGQLPAVADVFGELADVKLGRLRARVTSAVPLDPAAAQAIVDRLARATRAEVILERAVDPELLGGAVAQVGSLTYDGSLRTQLEELRRQLKA